MKVTMLVENQGNKDNTVLKSEHGLSVLIEHNGKNILFDFGTSGIFIDNAMNMGLDIKDIDTVILSHAHIDHAGGLERFLQMNTKARAIMSINANQKCYINIFGKKVSVSIPPAVFERFCDRIEFIDGFTEISKDVFIIANAIERTYPLGRGSKRLLVKMDGGYQADSFNHELILAIKTDGGLVVFTGCSHNGIDNMIVACSSYFPDIPIKAVVGGFHLMGIPFKNSLGEKRESVEIMGKRILDMDIGKVYTCHCTGLKAFGILKDVMKDRIEYFNTGRQVEI